VGEWLDVSRSSWLERAAYDEAGRVMLLETKAGITYEVQGVRPGVWQAFVEASSRGRFVHRSLFPYHVKKVVD